MVAKGDVRNQSESDETNIENNDSDIRDFPEEEASGNGILVGTDEDDVLTGLGDNDVFLHSGGIDTIDGGDGFDLISYHTSVEPLFMLPTEDPSRTLVYMEGPPQNEIRPLPLDNLYVRNKASTEPRYSFKDSLKNIEAIVGGHGGDWLVGRDTTDVLVGGPGADILTGRGGRDFFVYWDLDILDYTPETVDVICDFHPWEGDRIDLSSVSKSLEQRLKFVGLVTSHASGVPYSIFYKKGVDPWDNPRFRDGLFLGQDNTHVFQGEEGLSLMADFDGDTRADLIIAMWGTDRITESDIIL